MVIILFFNHIPLPVNDGLATTGIILHVYNVIFDTLIRLYYNV